MFFENVASKSLFNSFLGALGGHFELILELLGSSWALLSLLVASLGVSWGFSGGS